MMRRDRIDATRSVPESRNGRSTALKAGGTRTIRPAWNEVTRRAGDAAIATRDGKLTVSVWSEAGL
jgi:hypothetical protein